MSAAEHFAKYKFPDRGSQEDKDKKRRVGIPGAIGRWLFFATLVFVVASVLLVGIFRFFPPPASSFMIKRYVDGMFQQDRSSELHYQWVDWENISPQMALAVVAAEDQKFPHHWGFDFQSIGDAIQERRTGGRLRGASTITQQTAKNLFLWEGRSFIRKGFEAWFTLLMETPRLSHILTQLCSDKLTPCMHSTLFLRGLVCDRMNVSIGW